MARQGFYHRSPLRGGIPFFAFMALGTYTLSLFVQTRYDYAVRLRQLSFPTGFRVATGSQALRKGRTNTEFRGCLSHMQTIQCAAQDQNKSMVSDEKAKRKSGDLDLEDELEVRFPPSGTTCLG